MVNPELVRELLRQLEAEKGGPVQLQVDTPESERYSQEYGSVDHAMYIRAKGRELFGAFSDRKVSVKRIESLEDIYLHDVALLEGEYERLEDLQQRIQDYNVLYSWPMPNTPAQKAFDIVQANVRGTLVHNSIAANFDGGQSRWGLHRETVERILQKNGIIYLQHNIIAGPDGVYNDRSSGGSIKIVDEVKIADITLKLIE